MPIPTSFYVWSGPVASLQALGMGVAVLVFVVFLKAVLFAAFLRAAWKQAFVHMVLANVITTVAGLAAGFLFTSGPCLFFGMILLTAATTALTEQTRQAFPPESSWAREGRLYRLTVPLPVLTMFATIIFLNAAVGAERTSLGHYLAWKSAALFSSFILTLPLTIAIEALLIMRFANVAPREGQEILSAAARATLATFFILFSLGAAIAIPRRLANPGGLMRGDWFRNNY